MPDGAVREAIAALWRQTLGPGRGLDIVPGSVSGNNRVFMVHADGRSAVAKWYCEGGTRDRLDSEWRFLEMAARAGITCVPTALARDDEQRLALHSLCAGRKVTHIGPADIDAAAAFFLALNEQRELAAGLPDAAEAAFSGPEHFAIIERRLSALAGIQPTSPVDAEAVELVERMTATWRRMRERLEDVLPDQPLAPGQRCISPSDFGFHNALRSEDGAVSFIDFEYAGWDDPAKALCDFALQPAVPVAPDLAARFVAAVTSAWPDGAALGKRAEAMRPLFALKWCCIMLNPFVPSLARPGRFSDPTTDPLERKTRQLAKARAAFQTHISGSD